LLFRSGDIRGAWEKACTRASSWGASRTTCDGARRVTCAGRACRRGRSWSCAGWRTRSIFDRYNIIDEADLAAAVAKRFNGRDTAKKPPVEQPTA